MATAGEGLNETAVGGAAVLLRVFLSNFVPDAPGPDPCNDQPQRCPAHPGKTFCATNYSADQVGTCSNTMTMICRFRHSCRPPSL